MTLDDYLHAVADIRRTFQLVKPLFSLKMVESQAGAPSALEAIIRQTIKRHGSEIYAKQHELIAGLGNEIYGEWTTMPAYAGHRIRQDRIQAVLRKAIELGLQTLVQLPVRDRKKARAPKLKPLAASLERLSGKLKAILQHEEVQARMRILEESNLREGNLLALSEELRKGASVVNAMANLKVKRIPSDARNPQVRWALYFIQWIAFSTGSQRYSEVTALFDSAFAAAGKRSPRWVSRLAIEMNFKRKRRKRWAQAITR